MREASWRYNRAMAEAAAAAAPAAAAAEGRVYVRVPPADPGRCLGPYPYPPAAPPPCRLSDCRQGFWARALFSNDLIVSLPRRRTP